MVIQPRNEHIQIAQKKEMTKTSKWTNDSNFNFDTNNFRNRHQILILPLTELKWINQFLLPVKWPKKLDFLMVSAGLEVD